MYNNKQALRQQNVVIKALIIEKSYSLMAECEYLIDVEWYLKAEPKLAFSLGRWFCWWKGKENG